MTKKIPFPDQSEIPDFYKNYVSYVKNDQLIEILENEKMDTIKLFNSLTPEQLAYQYDEGKWTPKEILLHVIDTERVFSYRILRIGRKDATPMPGFDQNVFMLACEANNRSVKSLIDEYETVRNATLSLVKNLPSEAWEYEGNASSFSFKPKTIAYILAGHELHHKAVLRERYLS